MAGTIKGITIQIEGKTSGLTKALQDVESQIKKDDAALKNLEKALELDPSNVDLLAAKEAVLADKTDAVASKMEILQQVQKDALSDLPGESKLTAAQMAELEAEIARTDNTLSKLSNEAEDASGDLKDVGSSAESAGNDAQDAGNKAESGGDGFEKFGAAAKVAAEAAAAAMAAAVAAITAVTKALAECTVDAAAYADEMLTLSSTTGLSTQTLQELSYASELLDVNVETVAGALKKCTKSMADAQDGSGAAAEAYAQLGVAVTDANGELRDNEDVFWDAVDALGQIENETERDALAMQIFGKSANELNPLIEAGAEQFQEYAAMASDAGAVLSDDVLDEFAAFDDQLQMLDGGANAAKNALGTILLPILSSLAGEGIDLLAQFTNGVLEADGDMSKITELIGDLIPQALDALLEQLPVAIELGSTIISALLEGLVSNLDLILTTAGDILITLVQGILNQLPQIVQTAVSIIFQLVNTLLSSENISLLTQAAVDIVITLVNSVADNLDMVIETAITIVTTILTTLYDNAPELMSASIELITALVFGILDHLDEVIEAAIEIVAALVGAIIECAPQLLPEAIDAVMEEFGSMGDSLVKDALTWGSDMIASLIDGIMNAAPGLKDTVNYVAGLADDYLGFSVPEKGPLSDFDKSGADMIDLFISSMNSQQSALESAISQTAGIINGSSNSFALATQDNTTPQVDYSNGLSRIEQAIVSSASKNAPADGSTWVFPIYIGNEPVDTLVVDAIDRYNYQTGGH